MHVRIVTFGLNVPAEAYTARALHKAPKVTDWPGLLGKPSRDPLRFGASQP